MHAPSRHYPRQFAPPPRDDACGGFPRRLHQSAPPQGGQSPGSLAINRQARPVNPHSATVQGTAAALAVRGNEGGDRSSLLPKGASRGGGAGWSPVPGGRGGKGACPTPSLSGSRIGQGGAVARNRWQAERQRSCSQESFASEHSLYSTPSQASSCSMSGARQQQVRKPAKPPPPPGPPPPHILEEQRRRRELATLQRAQQQSPNSGGGGGGGAGEPSYGGVDQRNHWNSRSSRDLQQRSSNSPRDRQAGDPMHLVQAGASILNNGKISSIKPSGSELYLNGTRSGQSAVGCDLETAAGFSHSRGGVTVLTYPAPGPLSLTPPGAEPERAVKDVTVLSPSSSEWQAFWDEEVEASYYYNCITREALWVRPDGF